MFLLGSDETGRHTAPRGVDWLWKSAKGENSKISIVGSTPTSPTKNPTVNS